MDKRSMDLEHGKVACDEWEIHWMVLVSLSLQVFLSLTADQSRCSTSLWLAYLSADMVAIFVLGHLAVRAQGPSHELILFWAPFMLVHLGGQDTIMAFSKQDNELWTRHLLGLVTQTCTVVAGYVVSKSSWPDARLRTAMVLMFLCGFIKYSGRTYCLYSASPKSLRASSMDSLSDTLSRLREAQKDATSSFNKVARAWIKREAVKKRFEVMFLPDRCWEFVAKNGIAGGLDMEDIMLVDTVVDDLTMTIAAEEVPDMLKDFKDKMTHRCIAYQYVAASLVQSYKILYTKAPLVLFSFLFTLCCDGLLKWLIVIPVILTYTIFQCISTVIALVLFASAEKEGHHSKADITVSYILLLGAIVLDLLPAFTSILFFTRKPFRPGTVIGWAAISASSCLQPQGWLTRKQWSEELAQYSMIRRYSTTSVQEYNGCMPFIRKGILDCKLCLGAFEFRDLTRTPVTDDLRLFVLNRLLLLQNRREEWDFASFRGDRALGKWMDSQRHQPLEPAERSGYGAMHESLSSTVDFPASVLIWHIATDISYFSSADKRIGTEPSNEIKKKMVMSRELSHYIMYLVFKCDVMLTTNSRFVHKETHDVLTRCFEQVQRDEKDTIMVMFEAMKEQPTKKAKQQQGNKDAAGTSSESGIQELLKSMEEAIYSPLLPRAYAMAQELICIDDEAGRWELISEVWLEMLFYTAPRCGAAFHYEHLATGGEFITHVLFLMRSLGPFMPKPGA